MVFMYLPLLSALGPSSTAGRSPEVPARKDCTRIGQDFLAGIERRCFDGLIFPIGGSAEDPKVAGLGDASLARRSAYSSTTRRTSPVGGERMAIIGHEGHPPGIGTHALGAEAHAAVSQGRHDASSVPTAGHLLAASKRARRSIQACRTASREQGAVGAGAGSVMGGLRVWWQDLDGNQLVNHAIRRVRTLCVQIGTVWPNN